MIQLVAILLSACIVILMFDNLQTRKALTTMSAALDALTAKVANLESQVTAVVAHVAALQASGEDAPALDALGTRIQAVADQLQAASTPKP